MPALTEFSPAISWARGADRLAFTYFENGEYTIWAVNNPRSLRKTPFREPAMADFSQAAVPTPQTPEDSPTRTVSLVALLDSFELGLPDTKRFRTVPYRVRLQPDFSARPTIAYSPDALGGRTVFGGTTLVMSDMLGNNHLAISGEINGRIREAGALLGYTNLAHRWQFSTALSQDPYYFLSADSLANTSDPGVATENQQITTYVARQAFAVTAYPLNRFTRIEFGAGFNNIDRTRDFVTRKVNDGMAAGRLLGRQHAPRSVAQLRRRPGRARLGQHAVRLHRADDGAPVPLPGESRDGSYNWVEYLADYRRYDPIIFNYLTLATRAYTDFRSAPTRPRSRNTSPGPISCAATIGTARSISPARSSAPTRRTAAPCNCWAAASPWRTSSFAFR